MLFVIANSCFSYFLIIDNAVIGCSGFLGTSPLFPELLEPRLKLGELALFVVVVVVVIIHQALDGRTGRSRNLYGLGILPLAPSAPDPAPEKAQEPKSDIPAPGSSPSTEGSCHSLFKLASESKRGRRHHDDDEDHRQADSRLVPFVLKMDSMS